MNIKYDARSSTYHGALLLSKTPESHQSIQKRAVKSVDCVVKRVYLSSIMLRSIQCFFYLVQLSVVPFAIAPVK